jgi:hypothetical protein
MIPTKLLRSAVSVSLLASICCGCATGLQTRYGTRAMCAIWRVSL